MLGEVEITKGKGGKGGFCDVSAAIVNYER